MAKRKAAASNHGPQGTSEEIRVARGSSPESDDALLELLLAAPPEDPGNKARRLFPGAEPPQECLRAAFVAIAAAQGRSAEAALLLARLRRSITADPEELDDSLEDWTVTEHELAVAGKQLETALRECRQAASMLRRTRRRSPPRQQRRKLKAVS